VPLFNALVEGEPVNSGLRNLASRIYRDIIVLPWGANHISISWTV